MQQPDAIIAALAVMRQRLMRVNTAYTPDQVQARLVFIAVLRDFARADDGIGFAGFCQRRLATEPDLTVSILEDLYWAVGMDSEKTTWDEFAAKFL